MQQVSMALNCFPSLSEANSNETGEAMQLSNVHNFQGTVNLMGRRFPLLRTDTYFALQHVSQNSQHLFTSQEDHMQLQQQYFLQLNNASDQLQTPVFLMDGPLSFNKSNEDDFSANGFARQLLSAAVPDYNRNVIYYSQPINDLLFINLHAEPEQQIRRTTQQKQISRPSIMTEQLSEIFTAKYIEKYSRPPPSMIFCPSKEVKKAPKATATFKTFKEKYFSNPGPIRASPPTIIFDETLGKELLVFPYSNKSIVTKFFLHCPQIDFSAPIDLDEEFLRDNCIYPKAMCSPEEYSGRRGNYERECNIIGWKLAEFNPEIRERRGLIQRAVDSWRNTREDIKIRSRRVRKEHKMKKRKQIKSV